MNIGDKVKITNVDKMWDQEIYFDGWELTHYGNDVPDFDESKYFENCDEAIIINSNDSNYSTEVMLEIILIDNNGKEVKCHSQSYSVDKLEKFCELT